MKKHLLSVAVVCCIGAGMLLPSCIGSFSLTNKLLTWNRTIDNKFVNELVFFAFWILPVYEVSAMADVLVLNSIEFWSGDNPVSANSRIVEGNDARYLVQNDEHGYSITNMTDGTVTRLDFDSESRSWSLLTPDGQHQTIFSFVDDTHITLPAPEGQTMDVELTQQGLWAYQAAVANSQYACR